MSDPTLHDARVPERLLALLDSIAAVLDRRGDGVALIGLGSVGLDLHRLDDHSDADFFVVVDDDAEARYIRDIDWLDDAAAVAWSFDNSERGRKVLFDDGLFAEYAVFGVTSLQAAGYPPGRLVWRRADAPAGLENPVVPLPPAPSLEHQVGEAVTNLYIGLHRDLRGERLSAARFIQVFAVDRLVTVLGLLGHGSGAQQDHFAVERGVERRFTPAQLPLARLMPGYEGNAAAALAVLEVLERHVRVEPRLAGAIRDLARQAQARSDPAPN